MPELLERNGENELKTPNLTASVKGGDEKGPFNMTTLPLPSEAGTTLLFFEITFLTHDTGATRQMTLCI